MKLAVIYLLVILAGVSWLFFRPRLAAMVARFGLALRVATVAYFLMLVGRLVTTGVDQDQMELAIGSVLFFAAFWGIAWLITRSMARTP